MSVCHGRFRPQRLANGEPTLVCVCGAWYDEPPHRGNEEESEKDDEEAVERVMALIDSGLSVPAAVLKFIEEEEAH